MADAEGGGMNFPPYPPYAVQPAPPSVADTIFAGRDLRYQHKSIAKKVVRAPPKPARPRGPKATDVRLPKKAHRAHARCLRRHNAVLSDRLEAMSKPQKRGIIYLWRQHGDNLPADTVARLRSMLDADEPFKPDQAYEYFVNTRKNTKQKMNARVNEIKKDMLEMCADTRFLWARNATVTFAKGIQQRLSRPGHYSLADGMLRLSNIILDEICGYMHMRTPSRRCAQPKAKFLMEMSDKVAIWIDEILSESDDKMLMMDYDEDGEVELSLAEEKQPATVTPTNSSPSVSGSDVLDADRDRMGFADDFLNMMGGGGGGEGGEGGEGGKGGEGGEGYEGPSAASQFTGDMLESFNILTQSMDKKGEQQLLKWGKSHQTYKEAVQELKRAPDFNAADYNPNLAKQVRKDLSDTVHPDTPANLASTMKDMVDMCGNYLAQEAEYNKDKGPAFKLLVQELKAKGSEILFTKDTLQKSHKQAAKELESTKIGLETDHDDEDVSGEINDNLTKIMETPTPKEMKEEMKDTVDVCAKYLSEHAVDETESACSKFTGEQLQAFKILTEAMFKKGNKELISYGKFRQTYRVASSKLKQAPDFEAYTYNKPLAEQINKDLTEVVKPTTPPNLTTAMKDMVDLCGNYLAQYAENNKDKGPAFKILLQEMKAKGNELLFEKDKKKQTHKEATKELERSPGGLATDHDHPELSQEIHGKLSKTVDKATPEELKTDMAETLDVASKYLSERAVDDTESAWSKLTGDQLESFKILTKEMNKKGNDPLLTHGKFKMSYKEGSERLKKAPNFDAPKFNAALGQKVNKDLTEIVSGNKTPAKLQSAMKDMVKMCGDYLAQYAEYNKDKGPAYKILIKEMRGNGDEVLFTNNNIPKTNSAAVQELETAKSGLITDSEDPALTKDIHANLSRQVDSATPAHLKADMTETLGVCSKYLSGTAIESAAAREGGAEGGAEGEADRSKTGTAAREGGAVGGADRSKTGRTRKTKKGRGRHDMDGEDPERLAAFTILQQELRSKGNAPLYSTPQTELVHKQAADWLTETPMRQVDNSVKGAADTAHLQKKFERKLITLVQQKTPETLRDAMQDVVIESAGILSEYFVAKNYKALVKDHLISEIQKKGNEILVEPYHGAPPETYFFAAQRLKKAPSMSVQEPCTQVSYRVAKHLEDTIRCRPMPRKLLATMKEHIKEVSDYLSEQANKPDEQIEAYVALISEMEASGENLLIEGDLPKSYKSSAAFLRQLTSVDDKINKPNSGLQSSTESKLHGIMANVQPVGYSRSVLNDVIRNSAKLLVSYITLQTEKTEALKILIDKLAQRNQLVLLRHGVIMKTHADGADVLRGKNADQLHVVGVDPVVSRKIQVKLQNLMRNDTPEKYKTLMDDVIEEATMYLAVNLLRPKTIKVCKCMKNELVQCELWCDEILRRVARPRCCTCSRHVSAPALADLEPYERPAIEIKQCPSRPRRNDPPRPCPALRPHSGCPSSATSYMIYSSSTWHKSPHVDSRTHTHVDSRTLTDSLRFSDRKSDFMTCEQNLLTSSVTQSVDSSTSEWRWSPEMACDSSDEPIKSMLLATFGEDISDLQTQSNSTSARSGPDAVASTSRSTNYWSDIYKEIPSTNFGKQSENICSHTPSFPTVDGRSFHVMSSGPNSSFPRESPSPDSYGTSKESPPRRHSPTRYQRPIRRQSPMRKQSLIRRESPTRKRSSSRRQGPIRWQSPTRRSPIRSSGTTRRSPTRRSPTRRQSPTESTYSTRVPIVSTDKMSEWHAMMISVMWNVQGWRDWIQESIDKVLEYQYDPNLSTAKADENWEIFQRGVTTQALQWRQYNTFSRQLTMRLILRYRNKEIVSPTRATSKTKTFTECQQDMLDIIGNFNKWSHWLTAIINESNTLAQVTGSNIPIHKIRWLHLKSRVEEYLEDWVNYNKHLRVCWEHKYRALLSEWLPAWKLLNPVWVVSAFGTVPSGAVPAGVYNSEIVWVARTTHRCKVLPAALLPSKYCCIVYGEGAVYYYTKYQVMCNTDARWVKWNAGLGTRGVRAVRVAPGEHVGRVLYRGSHLVGAVHAPHYRCNVVVYGQPFAFNWYELLVHAED